MHSSYFAILDIEGNAQKELQVAANVSEWLVAKKFWQLFNEQFQTDFAHFEESTLPVAKIEWLVLGLENQIKELKQFDNVSGSFRYGWTAEKTELLCDIEPATFTQEIRALVLLLQTAKSQNKEIYCQL
jgi:hypothetical protein